MLLLITISSKFSFKHYGYFSFRKYHTITTLRSQFLFSINVPTKTRKKNLNNNSCSFRLTNIIPMCKIY